MVTFIVSFIFAAVCLAACTLMVRKERKARKLAIAEALDYVLRRMEESEHRQNLKNEKLCNDLKETEKRVADLENGIIPDFEQAKEAVKSVNDFNKGISAIMGYDPFEARRKAQEERGDNR